RALQRARRSGRGGSERRGGEAAPRPGRRLRRRRRAGANGDRPQPRRPPGRALLLPRPVVPRGPETPPPPPPDPAPGARPPPGTALGTSDPGTGADGEPAFASISGTSAAAASVAGAAAVLAQARPGLGAPDLRSLLVGYAHPSAAALTTAGLGEVDVGAAAAA